MTFIPTYWTTRSNSTTSVSPSNLTPSPGIPATEQPLRVENENNYCAEDNPMTHTQLETVYTYKSTEELTKNSVWEKVDNTATNIS
ncbi:hypothetical protein T265_01954 [Opisthorchis viverrini]|uniref:Uncharacterized protein n=1 Tax=Opisthorchis viverrini TaxID=6198 RepID=A0A075AIL9_OPIVI|nr:hypothetical protein T265_01954 [Opisthorchis viverrini]KER31864.1 hypothetical protein T265_01954 [Opisthorchis viverrini]